MSDVDPVELGAGVAPAAVLRCIREAVDLAYKQGGDLARVNLPATFVDWLWQQRVDLERQLAALQAQYESDRARGHKYRDKLRSRAEAAERQLAEARARAERLRAAIERYDQRPDINAINAVIAAARRALATQGGKPALSLQDARHEH